MMNRIELIIVTLGLILSGCTFIYTSAKSPNGSIKVVVHDQTSIEENR